MYYTSRVGLLSLILRLAFSTIFIICLRTIVCAETPGIQWHTILASKNLELCHETGQIDFAQAVVKATQQTINPCELVTLTHDDLRVIRNTIFAKYGREFKDEKLRKYFEAQSWYKVRLDYNDDLLSPDQIRNAVIIKSLEDLKRSDNVSSNRDIIESISERNVPPALAILDFLSQQAIDKKYHDLYKYKQPDNYQYSCRESKAAFLPVNNQLLLTRPCMFRDDNICYSDIYSIDKKKEARVPFCPKYYLKDNPNLFVAAENIGCCGTSGWRIRFYNLFEKKLINPGLGCDPDLCRSMLFTWMPDIEKFITASSEVGYQFGSYSYSILTIGIVDKNGAVKSSGSVKAIYLWPSTKYPASNEEIPFVAKKLTGIKEIDRSRWLIKFNTPRDSIYMIATRGVSNNKDTEQVLGIIKTKPPIAKVTIDGVYRGVSPLSVILQRGMHKITVSREGYQVIEQTIDWSSERIKHVWLNLIPK